MITSTCMFTGPPRTAHGGHASLCPPYAVALPIKTNRDLSMSVIAIFKYDIKPGRLPDFLKKLAQAAEFNSPVMPKSVRMFRSTVPGPGHGVILMIEYEDMAAYGARTAFEHANAEWRQLFEPTRDSPEALISVELLTELPPEAAGPDETERAPVRF